MKKKPNKKKIIILVIVLVLIAAVGIGLVRCSLSVKDAVDSMMGVQVQELAKHDLSSSINATGTVESQNVVSVTTDLTCKVKELNVALGDHVEVGDVLCTFDSTDVEEQIKDLEAQVSASEKLTAKQNQIAERDLQQAKDSQTSEVNKAQKDVNDAQSEYDQAVANYNSVNVVGADPEAVAEASVRVESKKAALDTAKSALDSTTKQVEASVQAAQDTVDTNAISQSGSSDASKELSKLYRQLDEMTVTAEQAGIITQLNISQGSIPNGTLMQIEDDTNLKVNVSIKEKDIVKLQEGMKAKITADALPDNEYTGVVSKVINFASSSTSSTGTDAMSQGTTSGSSYSATVNVDEASGLLLGMSVKVEITLKESGEALSVAYDSIVSDEDGTSYIYRAVKQDNSMYKIEKIDVTTGESSDYYTAITSDGLNEGDLIVSTPEEVTDGAEIAIYIPNDSELYDTTSEQ